MALGITDSKYYSEIASAIRAITAGTETYKPREMANQINVDIAAAKSSISNALVNKGISPPEVLLKDLPNYISAIDTTKPEQTKTVTPSLSSQIIIPDSGKVFSSVTVNPITSSLLTSLDADFKAANIAKGVNMFGLVGTLEPDSLDTAISLIDVIFPIDATFVSCSNGMETYIIPDKWLSNGHYIFGIKNVGTWTLIAKKGDTETTTKSIEVVSNQLYKTELNFKIYYYNLGDKCTALTGGYTNYGIKSGTIKYNATNITITCGWGQSAAIRTTNRVDLSTINTLYFKIKGQASSYEYGRGGISTTEQAPKPGYTWVSYFNPNSPYDYKIYSLDISNVTGSHYIACGISDGNDSSSTYEIESIWGEK